jgi:hypothetical protein
VIIHHCSPQHTYLVSSSTLTSNSIFGVYIWRSVQVFGRLGICTTRNYAPLTPLLRFSSIQPSHVLPPRLPLRPLPKAQSTLSLVLPPAPPPSSPFRRQVISCYITSSSCTTRLTNPSRTSYYQSGCLSTALPPCLPSQSMLIPFSEIFLRNTSISVGLGPTIRHSI